MYEQVQKTHESIISRRIGRVALATLVGVVTLGLSVEYIPTNVHVIDVGIAVAAGVLAYIGLERSVNQQE